MQPKKIPVWQIERSTRLHRVCLFIKSRTAKGQSISKAVRTFSRRWNGKPLNADASRHYALSEKTLYRLYLKWRRGGETASALKLNYASARRRIPALVLVRFIELCAAREFPSFRAAWKAFYQRWGKRAPGYHSLRWNLPKGCFAQFKSCWKSIRQAQDRIQFLRFQYTAEIRARVPDRLPRRRGPDFQI